MFDLDFIRKLPSNIKARIIWAEGSDKPLLQFYDELSDSNTTFELHDDVDWLPAIANLLGFRLWKEHGEDCGKIHRAAAEAASAGTQLDVHWHALAHAMREQGELLKELSVGTRSESFYAKPLDYSALLPTMN